jgi:hypothetical protein
LTHRASGFAWTPIFRSVAEYSGDVLLMPHNRQPKRVPVIVDNIWEFFRPIEMPSRRSSAFGSPSIELARQSGPSGGRVYRVAISEPYIIAQIYRCPDASQHIDVGIIPSCIQRSGLPAEIINTLSAARLSREIVGSLLEDSPEISARIANCVHLWSSCRRVRINDSYGIDPIGEFFFEAPLGYRLEEIY